MVSNKTISFVAAGGMTFLSLAAFAVLTQPAAKAEPGSHSANASVIVAPTCSMTTTTVTPHTATILNGNRAINIGKTTLEAFCNDTGGFAIYAAGYTGNTYSDNRLVSPNSTSTPDVINSGNTATGNTSSWGVKASVTEGTTYPAVIAPDFISAENDGYVEIPDEFALLASRNSVTSKSAGSGLDITYGAYVSPSQAAGTYTGQVIYVMVHPANASAPTEIPGTFGAAFADAGKTKLNGYYKMQDMTSSICAEVDEDEVGELIDVRDNTVYHVGKLKDGKCWLLDNLALDLLDEDASTNINASNTNADADSLTSLFSGNRANGGQYATAGISNWTSSYSYSAPLINVSNIDVLPTTYNGTDEPLASTVANENWKVGVYYNYCAASAGSYCYGSGTSSSTTDSTAVDKPNTAIDAEYDICPSGWRMPTGYSYDATARPDGGEYLALYNAYSGTSGTGEGSRYANFRKALRLPLSGYFYNGTANYQGSYGIFWSSTYYYSGSMYGLRVYTSNINPQDYNYRYYGFSVRCIAQ